MARRMFNKLKVKEKAQLVAAVAEAAYAQAKVWDVLRSIEERLDVELSLHVNHNEIIQDLAVEVSIPAELPSPALTTTYVKEYLSKE